MYSYMSHEFIFSYEVLRASVWASLSILDPIVAVTPVKKFAVLKGLILQCYVFIWISIKSLWEELLRINTDIKRKKKKKENTRIANENMIKRCLLKKFRTLSQLKKKFYWPKKNIKIVSSICAPCPSWASSDRMGCRSLWPAAPPASGWSSTRSSFAWPGPAASPPENRK